MDVKFEVLCNQMKEFYSFLIGMFSIKFLRITLTFEVKFGRGFFEVLSSQPLSIRHMLNFLLGNSLIVSSSTNYTFYQIPNLVKSVHFLPKIW